ncbi:sugar phosphate isomerase/epimerase family protein [Sphingomonas oryzagri]
MNRRAFVAGAGALAAASTLGSVARAAQLGRIGLQLYTVREIFQSDPVGTLEKVARIGYREVEYGGGNYDTMDHALLRRTMDRLHLSSPSLHIPYDTLLNRFGDAVKMAKTLGADTIVVPWLSEEFRTEAGFAPVVSNVNRFAKQAHDAGLGLAYHNHDFEFLNRSGGTSLYDRLVDGTDPALVKLELDLYWAVHAGQDAGKLIDRLSGRLYAFHAKDMKTDRSMAAVGTGTIDFAALFKRPGAAKVQHFYVENDDAPAPYLPDITTSFKNLRALRF